MVYTGVNNQLLGTDKIEKLTSGQIDSLDIGNTVILDVNGEQKTFFVSKKTASEFCMIHTGKDKVIEVKYEWEDGAWAYDSTTETAVGGIKLYKHSISGGNLGITIINTYNEAIDNGNKLAKVIAGSLQNVISITFKYTGNLCYPFLISGSKYYYTEQQNELKLVIKGNPSFVADLSTGEVSITAGSVLKTFGSSDVLTDTITEL